MMTEATYMRQIKVRALVTVLLDELDAMQKEDPSWKRKLKSTGGLFMGELEKEFGTMYKNLPQDVLTEYNNLSNALQDGIDEIIRVSIT